MFFEDGWPPWDIFQARIKAAIIRGSSGHDCTNMLLTDLHFCEMLLREGGGSIAKLRTLDSPVANELCDALEAHAAEDPVQYDEICAANVVLAAMNAIAQETLEAEP